MNEQLLVELRGISPLIMRRSNTQREKPLIDWRYELKQLDHKTEKTTADWERMAYLDFIIGLYYDKQGVYIPAEVIYAVLVGAAKRIGNEFKIIGLMKNQFECAVDRLRLLYDGPRKRSELWKNKDFIRQDDLHIGGQKKVRTRAQFKQWGLRIPLRYHAAYVSREELVELLTIAGRECGLGEWRPEFGQFKVVSIADTF